MSPNKALLSPRKKRAPKLGVRRLHRDIEVKKDTAWKGVGEHWKLESFQEFSPPNWSEYLRDNEKYWGEDRISGSRSKDWQWKGSREKWLEITKKDYESQLEYCTKWHGKFSKGELIPVLRTENSNVIKLCIVKNNKTTWHDTLELWLFNDIRIIPPSRRLKSEIYTFSTTVDSSGNPCASWSQGEFDTKIRVGKEVVIGDAVFTITGA